MIYFLGHPVNCIGNSDAGWRTDFLIVLKLKDCWKLETISISSYTRTGSSINLNVGSTENHWNKSQDNQDGTLASETVRNTRFLTLRIMLIDLKPPHHEQRWAKIRLLAEKVEISSFDRLMGIKCIRSGILLFRFISKDKFKNVYPIWQLNFRWKEINACVFSISSLDRG